ncbi:MAG: DUF3943 domain-containing protein [Candidatus Krumholzibacteriota bacterium]
MKVKLINLIFLVSVTLLAGLAAPCAAQTDPVRNPDQAQGTLPPEKWDANEPKPIDWDKTNRSALTDTSIIVKKNFTRAAVEVVGLNALIWFYDRYIREGGTNPGFRIGFNSMSENLANGFEWDDNNFSTNQIDHPYHGSQYFNAARGNGYTFWESVPFTFAGSYLWEFFFEVHHPSMNDWIATSVGGVTLGEMLHRLSMTVRDNTATGSSRNWREVGGMLINPMGGLNRILDGDWGRVYANSPDRFPANYSSQMDIGFRTVADDQLWQTDTTRVYMKFDFEYGDMFFGDMDQPFDSFDMDLQLNFADVKLVGRVEVNGMLAGTFLKETDPSSHILAGFLRYDYLNNSKVEFGAQSLGAGLMSRFETDSGLEIRTELHTNAIILGANKSDYRSTSGRTYDYGPGAGVDLAARIGRNGWHYLHVGHTHSWIHTVNGNDADHFLGESFVRMELPIRFNLGLGLEYRLINSRRNYHLEGLDDVNERIPELRLATTWLLN